MPDKEIDVDIKEGYPPPNPPTKPRRDDAGFVPPEPPKKPSPPPKKND